MPGPGVVLDRTVGPFATTLDADVVRRFAAATRDPSAAVQAGALVPPAALILAIWDAQNAAREALVPKALSQAATGGVHGEHDLAVHRLVRPGEPLQVWVDGWGARPAGANSLVTLHYRIVGAQDDLVADQWWTTVLLGVTCDPSGQPPPEHAFPASARERPVGTCSLEVDDDMARRYAAASGDWSAHHFEVDAARRSGFERTFLHGLCTMALGAQAIVQLAADGDPARLRRLAVRFATPTFLGEQLDVRVYDAGPAGYAFEADAAGATVITHGRAELS